MPRKITKFGLNDIFENMKLFPDKGEQ